MLTIQPNFRQATNRNISFKQGYYSINSAEDSNFCEKTLFYENQAKEFGQMSKDKKTPDFLKKTFKGCQIAAEGLFDGWLVMWGTSKGSKFIKNGILTSANSNVAKEFKTILKPVTKGLQSARNSVAEAIAEGAKRFKNSEFLNKMNNNAVGRQIVKVFELIGSGVKLAATAIKSGYNAIASHFKGKSASEVFDKTAKATGTTLGVGAGIAGVYNAATRPDEKTANKKNSQNYDNDNDYSNYEEYQHDYGNDDDRDIADNNTDLEKEYLEELENMEYGE